MAEFKWIKGNKPKEHGYYLITVKDGDDYWVFQDWFAKNKKWVGYETEEILAYAPLPKPFRPRSKRNGSKSNNSKTKSKTRK